MGQRELLFVVIASLAVGSCVADYESNGKNLSWIYDIKNSATTQNQTYRLDTETGAFRYHFDISAVDSYKFETNSNDAVTMGCYGWKDLTNKWHGTNYVADSHGRRNVRDIHKPVDVYPSENEHATRLFLDHLPQCLAFALDTPPLMVYVFTNHPPTKPPPVVFEPHDHVPHSSEVVHKIHEGHVPPYTGGGSPTVPLAKTTGGGSVKIPLAKTTVTGKGSVELPLTKTTAKGGGSVELPLTKTTVTGAGPLTLTPVSPSPSSRPSTTAEPAVDLIAEVTSVAPILSSYRTVKGRQDLDGLSTQLPKKVISSGSGEDLTDSKTPLGINLSLVPTTLGSTTAPYGTPISIQSIDGSTSRPSSTLAPPLAVTGVASSKESSYGTRLVSTKTEAGDLEIVRGTPSGLLEGTNSGIGIGKPLVSLFTVDESPGTPTGVSLPEGKSGFEIGPPLVPVSSFEVSSGSTTGATLLDKPSNPPVSISTTTADPSDSKDSMNIFNPSKWGKALKSMVNAVLTVGQKILGIPKEPTSETSASTLRPDLSPTPSRQAVTGPITTLYKVDIPTLSKNGLTSIGSKLVDLPTIGPLSQDAIKIGAPSGSPSTEIPSGFKISVKETNPGPDSIINIDVSPPAPAFIANFASSKTTLSSVKGSPEQKVLIASPAPATDSGTPSASSLAPTGRPFEGTTTRPVSELHVDVSEFVPTSSRRPDTAPAIPIIPSANLPIDDTLLRLPQYLDNVVISQKLPPLPGFTITSPQVVQTVPTGFSPGSTISTIGEFITSRPISQAGIGLLQPSSTPSTFTNRYDFSTNSDRPGNGPSSTASGLARTVTAAYLPPPTAEGPLCSCVCPRG